MSRCDLVKPLSALCCSRSPLDHLFHTPLSMMRVRLEKWGGGLAFPLPVFSLNDFMPSLWMSVSSPVSKGAGADDPIDLFQLGSV